jgi:acyl carrier protein
MDDLKARLVSCFQTVFPDLSDEAAATASQATLAEWDSVAAITLVNVVEDEFGIEMDLDALADLDTFDKVCAYVQAQAQAA